MTDFKSKKYSIGDTAGHCGVTVKQIRNWEACGYIPEATRIICGERAYRYFSETDFDIIRRIKSNLDEGFRLPVAAEKAAEETNRKGGNKDA